MGKPLIGKRKRGHALRRQREFEPKLVENDKVALLIRGRKASETSMQLLRDLRTLKAENAILFSRKNDFTPFEEENKVEFLCEKNNACLFAFVSTNKKRPNNLVIGRLFDGQILDMFEFGVSNFESLQDVLKRNGGIAKAVGSPTAIIFQGDLFEKDETMKMLKSLLLDFFKGSKLEEVELASVDHCIVCSSSDNTIAVRNYVVAFKKQKPKEASAKVGDKQKAPPIALIEMGPAFNLTLRRNKLSSPSLMKQALRKPKLSSTPKKVKNVSQDVLKGRVGKVHMEKQDFTKLVTRSRFTKALKGDKESTNKKGTKTNDSA